MTTKAEFEAALDAGRVQVQCQNGRWYDVRRNGQTKTWKTRPTEWQIPIKWAFRSCGTASNTSVDSGELRIV